MVSECRSLIYFSLGISSWETIETELKEQNWKNSSKQDWPKEMRDRARRRAELEEQQWTRLAERNERVSKARRVTSKAKALQWFSASKVVQAVSWRDMICQRLKHMSDLQHQRLAKEPAEERCQAKSGVCFLLPAAHCDRPPKGLAINYDNAHAPLGGHIWMVYSPPDLLAALTHQSKFTSTK